ncbi:MAG TPA: Ni/Fe hydrogenase subunit alpha [Candidatus Saccharimonadales bacterium]|nr:Ni/Fe hydrogenase subunit alpha [Candidatus Saccharimonadales bacterium]
MGNTITIDPITRIEGHAKITLHLDDKGDVAAAQFHTTQFRGFEKLCEGRPFYEMPYLMERICGICPVSHLLASAKACDALLAMKVPPAAGKLRRILELAQLIQSHALSFFYLSSPDLILGMDADPKERNIFGVVQKQPELARWGIRLRQFGQQIIETLAGKRIHPAWVVPGGVNEPLSVEKRDKLLAQIPEAINIAQQTLKGFKWQLENFRAEIRTFANFPSLFMGLVTVDERAGYYQGKIRFTDSLGNIVADNLEPADYQQFIGEAVEPYTFMKFPYYKPMGYPDGMYRVGPLARLNLVDNCGTPLAQQEWIEFRDLERSAVLSSFHYHYARLIEILFALEHIQEYLEDPIITKKQAKYSASLNNLEGVGCCEAPRGTLIHHYRVDEQGLITFANLIIATGHNNLAMNRGILQAARHFVRSEKLTEGMLNRVEAVIRAFDPCLSCSTHADGHMALHVQLLSPDRKLIDEIYR